MPNLLTYEELTDLAEAKNKKVTKIALQSGMSVPGFRTAIRNKTISAENISLLCQALNITPNELFRIKDDTKKPSKSAIQTCDRISYESKIAELQTIIQERDKLLAEKNIEIREKEKQVNYMNDRLFSLLESKQTASAV